VRADVVNVEDVRVIERAGRPCLLLESSQRLFLMEPGSKELDGNVAASLRSWAMKTRPIPPRPISWPMR